MIDMKGGFSHSRISTVMMRLFVLLCLIVSNLAGSSLGATEVDSDRPQDLAKLSDFDLGLVYLTAQQDEQKIP